MQRQIRPESFHHDRMCLCEDPNSQHCIESQQEEVHSRICQQCNTERTEYTLADEDDSSADVGEANDNCEQQPSSLNLDLQINENHVAIDSYEKAASLRRGHHIAWARDKSKIFGNINYSHHAIVESNDDTFLSIIHYARDETYDNKIRIHRSKLNKMLDTVMNYGTLFCIQYPKSVLSKNPPDVVLSRALAKLGQESYNLVTNNCESFASLCKMGVSHSLQVYTRFTAALKKLRLALTPLCAAAKIAVWLIQFFSAEMVEALASSATHVTCVNVIGFALYLVAEGVVVSADIYNLFKGRRAGRINDVKEFRKAIAKRIVLAFGRAVVGTAFSIPAGMAGAAVGAAIGTALPIVGTAIGAGVGGIVGSITGGVGGVAALEGSRTIIWSFWNSKDITSIFELKRGDHIIVCGQRFIHPRCHAIVTDVDIDNNRIKVVRNLYKHGVVEQYIMFENVKRIQYSFASCYPENVVIERARSKIGQRRYNIAIFNCKTFSKQQKMREEFNF